MKKRIVKKWLNRYITPLIEDLPKIATAAHRIDLGDGKFLIAERRYMFANGYPIYEGERAPLNAKKCTNLLLNIKRTAQRIENVRNVHDHVFLRLIEVRGNAIRIRLTTD